MIKSREPLQRTILFMLSDKDMCGYTIREEIKAMACKFHDTKAPSFGSIYPALKNLQEKGMIDSYKEGKKIKYKIKPEGRKTIKNKIIEGFDNLLEMWPRYEKICKGHDMINLMKIGHLMRKCKDKKKARKLIDYCLKELEAEKYEKK